MSHFVRQFAAVGGLLSYGPHQLDVPPSRGIRWTNSERVESGRNACPAADTFELVINLKTAHALGLTVPLTLQAATDEVIE
jgi:putative tryptophan/tyrosine transport system substrate-binding protein